MNYGNYECYQIHPSAILLILVVKYQISQGQILPLIITAKIFIANFHVAGEQKCIQSSISLRDLARKKILTLPITFYKRIKNLSIWLCYKIILIVLQ